MAALKQLLLGMTFVTFYALNSAADSPQIVDLATQIARTGGILRSLVYPEEPLRKSLQQKMIVGTLAEFLQQAPLIKELYRVDIECLSATCRHYQKAFCCFADNHSLMPSIIQVMSTFYGDKKKQRSWEHYKTVQKMLKAEIDQEEIAVCMGMNVEENLIKRQALLAVRSIDNHTVDNAMRIIEDLQVRPKEDQPAYLKTERYKFSAIAALLESEEQEFVLEYTKGGMFCEYRKTKPPVPHLYDDILQAWHDTPELETIRASLFSQEAKDASIFDSRLQQLNHDFVSLYLVRWTLEGIQYGCRMVAAHDVAVLHDALKIRQHIEAELERVPDVQQAQPIITGILAQTNQPVQELIALCYQLQNLSKQSERQRYWQDIEVVFNGIEGLSDEDKYSKIERISADVCLWQKKVDDALRQWEATREVELNPDGASEKKVIWITKMKRKELVDGISQEDKSKEIA